MILIYGYIWEEKEQVSKYLCKPLAQSPYGGGPHITSTLTLNLNLHFNKAEETCPNINKLSGCPGKSGKLLFSLDSGDSEAEIWSSKSRQRQINLCELTAFTMFQILCRLQSTKMPQSSKTNRLKDLRGLIE